MIVARVSETVHGLALTCAMAVFAVVVVVAGCEGAHLGCSERDSGESREQDENPAREETPGEPRDAGAEVPTAVAAMAEVIVLTSVQVEIIEPSEPSELGPVELYPRQLGQQIGRHLGESGLFADRHELVPDGYRARLAELEVKIRYHVIDADRSSARQGEDRREQSSAVVVVESAIVWQDGGVGPSPWNNVIVERLVRRPERSNLVGILATLAESSMAEIGDGLIAKERIRVGGGEAVRRGLDSSDGDTRLWSLELCAARRSVEFFDEVARNLASHDTEVRDRAIAALVAMGDPRAVDLLARRARFDDLELLPVIIDGVATLGGEDARQYLEFLASGHPEDEIRQRARDGLVRSRPPTDPP